MANHLNWKDIEKAFKEESGSKANIDSGVLDGIVDAACLMFWLDEKNFGNDAIECPHCGNKTVIVAGHGGGFQGIKAQWDFRRNVIDGDIWYMDIPTLRFNSVGSFDDDDVVWVECCNCGARGGESNNYDGAVKLWNKRYRQIKRPRSIDDEIIMRAEELCMSKNPPFIERCYGNVSEGVKKNAQRSF